jgi:hypothetical protein
MSELESLWRSKTDAELARAGAEIRNYTVHAQRVIRAELQRRNMPVPEVMAEDADGQVDEPDMNCLRCGSELGYLGPRKLHETGDVRVLGALTVSDETLDVYVCSRCDRVELFVHTSGREHPKH